MDSASEGTELARMVRSERRWLILLIVGLIIWTMTDVRRRARIDPEKPHKHRTDLTVFTGAGAAFFAADEPYDFATIRGWKYAYPPLFALLMAPLDSLPSTEQAVVWCFICLAMAFASWYEVVRISKHLGHDVRLTRANHSLGRLIGWLAVIAIALPIMNCLQRGQVGVTKLYLMLLGFRLMIEASGGWRMALGAAVFALPVAIKITPALPLSVLAWQVLVACWARRESLLAPRTWALPSGAVAGLVLYLLVIPGLLLGWDTNLGYLQTWYQRMATMEVDPEGQIGTPYTVRNQSLTNATHRLANWCAYTFAGGPDDRIVDTAPSELPRPMAMDARWVGVLITSVKVLSLGMLMVLATLAGLRQDRLAQAAVLGLALVATMIVSPIGRGHYYMLILPALIWVPLRLSGVRSVHWVRCVAAVPTLLILAHYLGLHFAGRIGLLGIGITLWYMTTATDLLLILARAQRQVAAVDQTGASLRRAA